MTLSVWRNFRITKKTSQHLSQSLRINGAAVRNVCVVGPSLPAQQLRGRGGANRPCTRSSHHRPFLRRDVPTTHGRPDRHHDPPTTTIILRRKKLQAGRTQTNISVDAKPNWPNGWIDGRTTMALDDGRPMSDRRDVPSLPTINARRRHVSILHTNAIVVCMYGVKACLQCSSFNANVMKKTNVRFPNHRSQ